MSLPSSYRSQQGHIHLPRVLPLVGCQSKTPTLARFRCTGGSLGQGGGWARPYAHLGPRGGRSWGGEITGVGARRGPAAVAAAGGVAGEEGSRLANKRRLCLTCELGRRWVCRPAMKSLRKWKLTQAAAMAVTMAMTARARGRGLK
jgi:hypothetical protein